MRSLVSSIFLFVLLSVTLFAFSNLYVSTLLITVHSVGEAKKGETGAKNSWKTVDLFHNLKIVILALLCLTIDI